jgi:hypothetical protein
MEQPRKPATYLSDFNPYFPGLEAQNQNQNKLQRSRILWCDHHHHAQSYRYREAVDTSIGNSYTGLGVGTRAETASVAKHQSCDYSSWILNGGVGFSVSRPGFDGSRHSNRGCSHAQLALAALLGWAIHAPCVGTLGFCGSTRRIGQHGQHSPH